MHNSFYKCNSLTGQFAIQNPRSILFYPREYYITYHIKRKKSSTFFFSCYTSYCKGGGTFDQPVKTREGAARKV